MAAFPRLVPPRWAGTPLGELHEHLASALGDAHRPEAVELIMGSFAVRDDQTIAPHLAFEDSVEIARALWEQDAADLYAGVKCPALFLASLPPEPRDPFAERFLLWKKFKLPQIEALMPQARIEWLADSIHDVHLQRPELIAEKIQAFARTVGF